ncbi:MAG: response regulator, partial [Rhodocyclaceae bacterium]|nr:response regulator [Rhodocyclaceae bacterium]
MNHSILAIDKKLQTWERIEPFLKSKGFELLFAHDEPQGIRILQAESIDLVLLNKGMAETDYLEIISSIRTRFVVPVVVLAQDSKSSDRITGLEMGADDFITTPFEMEELAARIKANLRLVDRIRYAVESERHQEEIAAIQFRGWRLDLRRHQLLDEDGEVVGLTPGEYQLLETLARSPGVALSRTRLFAATRERGA